MGDRWPKGAAGPVGPAGPQSLRFFFDSLGTTTTTRYLRPGISGTAPATPYDWAEPIAASYSTLYYTATTIGAGTETITVTLYKNGNPTALSLSYLPTDADGYVSVAAIPFGPGDKPSLVITKSGNVPDSGSGSYTIG